LSFTLKGIFEDDITGTENLYVRVGSFEELLESVGDNIAINKNGNLYLWYYLMILVRKNSDIDAGKAFLSICYGKKKQRY